MAITGNIAADMSYIDLADTSVIHLGDDWVASWVAGWPDGWMAGWLDG